MRTIILQPPLNGLFDTATYAAVAWSKATLAASGVQDATTMSVGPVFSGTMTRDVLVVHRTNVGDIGQCLAVEGAARASGRSPGHVA